MEQPQYKRAGRISQDLESGHGKRTHSESEVRFRWRLATWAGTLLLSMLMLRAPKEYIGMCWMYPMGFDAVIGAKAAGGSLGYIVHLVLLILMLGVRRRRFFLGVAGVLIIVCVLNTIGCHEMLKKW